MKTVLFCATLLLFWNSAQGDIIAQWNFNSTTPDGNTATGCLTPSLGNGSASLVGGAGATFAGGCTNDSATADNSGWNTSSYPSQGSSNKTAGVQFNVSTLGYSNIVLRWDHRVSGSASKYCRLLYSSDGANFLDYSEPVTAVAVMSSRPTYFEIQTNWLAAMPEVENCDGFAFRIVSEFESSATGGGTNGYVTTYTTNNYSRSGTIRLDMVTVLGTPIPGANTPPSISGLTNQTLRVGQTGGPWPLNVWDAEDSAEDLVLNATSSNPAVVGEADLVFGGSGGERNLTLTAGNEPGISTITVYVVDTGGRSNNLSFLATVLPLNTPPFISSLARTNTLVGIPTQPVSFTVGDLESPAGNLTVSASSANPALVPNTAANIFLSGMESNRTVTLVPAADQTGVAPITVSVSDGEISSTSTFALLVTPSPEVILYDPFSYADGSLLTNSGYLWQTRSGTRGQCQVANGCLQLSAEQTEDVVAPLIGGPYAKSNSTVLYVSFKVRFLSAPNVSPGLFAHFADGSVLRGRIYAATTNAWTGGLRLFVGNGADTPTMLPMVISTNSTYTLVTRYDLDAAQTTIWLNPTTESDPSTTAADPQTATPIASYGFRQDSDIGATLLVDDLRVGLSFEAVVPPSGIQPIPLGLQLNGASLTLRWTNSAFALQSAPGVNGPFTTITGASSPYTTSASGRARFFRLKAN